MLRAARGFVNQMSALEVLAVCVVPIGLLDLHLCPRCNVRLERKCDVGCASNWFRLSS